MTGQHCGVGTMISMMWQSLGTWLHANAVGNEQLGSRRKANSAVEMHMNADKDVHFALTNEMSLISR